MIKVYLNQKPSTEAPSQKIKGNITGKKNSKGTPKFKRDEEGQEYKILSCSEPSDPYSFKGDKDETVTLVTYYLDLDDGQDPLPVAKGQSPVDQEARDAIKVLKGVFEEHLKEYHSEEKSSPDEGVESIPF